MKFFKLLYQIFRGIREFVLSLFFVIFVMICFAFTSFFTGSKTNKPSVQEGLLTLRLNGYLADNQDEYGNFYRLLGAELNNREEPQKYSTFDVAQAIEYAAQDSRITGLMLDLGKLQAADYPSLSYLGNKINDFKKSGKPVVAVGILYSQSQYYLASFADHIYLNEAGAVDIHGLNYSTLYFKSLFDKIEAKPEIFRVGTYKSAVEPLIRNDMSPEAKQNASLWLNTMWQQVRDNVGENRNIPTENVLPEMPKLLTLYKQAKGVESQYALNQKLVTRLVQGEESIKQALREDFEFSDQAMQAVEFEDYFATLPDRFNRKSSEKIAVVNVEGEITMGESTDTTAGAETIVKILKRVKEDNAVKGLILRINSPGGSAVASELIRQQVQEIQDAGKPVVASMGGMAASGGYWIAATSDKIVADPNTLTGSIGIFGVMFNLEQTAKNLGVREDGIATSQLANISGLKPLTPEQRSLIQMTIENGYDRFLQLVSTGRNLSVAEVDKIAQGQVWLGTTAKEKGLVDELGDFDTALFVINKLLYSEKENSAPTLEPQLVPQLMPQWFTEEDSSFFAELSRNMKAGGQIKLSDWFDLPVAKQAQKSVEAMAKFNDPKNTYLYCLACGAVK